MKQHRIPDNEQKQIAHYIAQRSLATIGSGEPNRALDKYLETYNNILEKLNDYNLKITN